MRIRTRVEELARDLCRRYHIQEIRTPAFEHTVLFQRGVGETTDVVQKEMYSFIDKGGRAISLKPEGTAGAMRAYAEHKMYTEPQPVRMFYITPAFRYEKPESGRLRQHHQFGVEIVGSESPLCEVELITLVSTFIRELGLSDAKLHLNSIGDEHCKPAYNKALIQYLETKKDDLCETCHERMYRNPLRVLDCKEDHDKLLDAPKTIDYLCPECREHFDTLCGMLDDLGIDYVVDPGIVRGLDYYTKTVFEFVNSDGFTLCGGGRYDNLVREIDGEKSAPSVGFGMGIERILYFLEKEGVETVPKESLDFYIGYTGDKARTAAYRIVSAIRKAGFSAETDCLGRSVKAQMKFADKMNTRYSCIIGDTELADQKARLRNMETGEEQELGLDTLMNPDEIQNLQGKKAN